MPASGAPAARRPVTATVIAALLTVSVVGYAFAEGVDRGLLWRVVQACVVNTKITGAAFPCLQVDIAKGVESGYAVVRAPLEQTHIVVVPTTRVIGVEAMALQEEKTENYFADAWSARHFVQDRASRPLQRDDLGLALNSLPGRSQDQLHIHVDCMKTSVRDTLRKLAPGLKSGVWTKLSVAFHGERYWATRLKSPDLRGVNIFQLVADGLHVTEEDQARVTIVVAGASIDGADGFTLLATIAARNARNQGHGEFLQDHTCAAG